MKKTRNILLVVLSIILLLASIPMSVFGTSNEDDFSYSILSDGTIKITQYNGTSTEVKIPPTIAGKIVSTIGSQSFYIDYGKTGVITAITSIDIPEGVTTIESGAFTRCTSLKTVIFPKTLQYIAETPLWDMGFGTKTILYCGSREEWNKIAPSKICDSYSKVSVTYDYIREWNGDDELQTPIPNSIKIGDYITLGTYYGEPIVWRCVDIDENGPLMLSDKILCFKSFDAKGDHGNYYRNKEGTNNWKESALRYWLNSIGSVDWSGRPAVPSEQNVFGGYNAYDKEQGFLTGFSEQELSMIKSVSQKTYINELDRSYADGGTDEYDTTGGTFELFFSGIENRGEGKLYQNVEDKIFLLGPEQAGKVYQNLGGEYLTAKATEQAKLMDTSGKDMSAETFKYWISLPATTGMSYENLVIIDDTERTYWMSALSVLNGNQYHSVGVRPAFYLKGDYAYDSSSSIKFGEDRFTFGKDITGYVGDEVSVLLVYASEKNDISSLNITSSDPDIVEVGTIAHGSNRYPFPDKNEHLAEVTLKLKTAGNAEIIVESVEGTTESIRINVLQTQKEFRFYLNTPVNNINIGNVVYLDIGYYLNNTLETSVTDYIVVIDNANIISASQDSVTEHGRRYILTAKNVGSAIITVTHPIYGDVGSITLTVNNDTAYNFYNIPKRIIEEGHITNFYNYSGMVVDGFDYKEHRDSSGKVDYYVVTMTIYNANNLYGAVTAYDSAGNISGYCIIDKKDDYETSFVDSLKALYNSTGDLFYLIKNESYYSGESVSKKTNVEIKVPVDGHLEISNNVEVAEIANLANFCALVIEMSDVMGDFADMGVNGDLLEEVKITVIKEFADEFISKGLLKSFKKTVVNDLKNMNFGDAQQFVASVCEKINLLGIDFMDQLKKKYFSLTGIASVGESVLTKVLPTGWIINLLYTSNKGLNCAMFFNQYCKSANRLGGIYIYAPTSGDTQVSNGVLIQPSNADAETIVHAYVMVDLSNVNLSNPVFSQGYNYTIYNITLYKNGSEAQANGIVSVSIPLPDDFRITDDIKVYRVNDDGSLTDMKAVYSSGRMTFETDHFSYYALVRPTESESDNTSSALLGDINEDGKIDAVDYMLLKRYVLGTYEIADEKKTVADVNKDGQINAVDYMLLKRHVLGTYKIA